MTDKNGNFRIPRAYTSIGGKVQIMVSFKNSNITLNAPGRWGYFSGNYAMEWKYPNNISGKNYKNILEDRLLDSEGKSKKYFYYGGFYDLVDENKSNSTDFTSGYTYTQLFRALTRSNVTNLNSFATSLVNVTNRQSDLSNVINTLEANHD